MAYIESDPAIALPPPRYESRLAERMIGEGDVERLLSVVRLENFVVGALQHFHDRCAVLGVVFDDEDGWSLSNSHKGKSIENVEPLPGWLSSTRCPLCSKMICCDVARPSPVP